MSRAKGPNPFSHLINRQLGSNKTDFRANLFSEHLKIAKNLYKKDLVSHYGCINAIEFSTEGELLISGKYDENKCLKIPLRRHLYESPASLFLSLILIFHPSTPQTQMVYFF